MKTEIVDVHAHLGKWPHYGMDATIDDMVEVMDFAGIGKVCVNHLFGGDSVYSNNFVYEATSKYPDRVVGFATFNLLYEEEVEPELGRCFDQLGMRGIKVYPPHHGSVDLPRYEAVFAFAHEQRLPVLCHTFPGDLPAFETVAEKYPGASFILGHAGGTEDGFGKAIELAKELPNVYLEICHSRRIFGLIERFVREVGAEKVLFGSDQPLFDPRIVMGRIMYADISDDDKGKILGGNARKLIWRS